MPTLTIDGTDIYYERRGAGEPLLLVQGLGGNILHWGDAFLEGLEDHFELVLYDHRGAGRSGAPAAWAAAIAVSKPFSSTRRPATRANPPFSGGGRSCGRTKLGSTLSRSAGSPCSESLDAVASLTVTSSSACSSRRGSCR